jgi:hypothetical protein
LTLETATFLAGAAFRAAGFGAAFFAFATGLDFAAAFFAAAFTGLRAIGRAGDFAAVARFAFGLAAALAFTARFAVFADAPFVFERVEDRRKPLARLLLMG